MEKYDITDYLKEDKELQKAKIQELLDDFKCAVMNVENLLETKQRLKGELSELKAENDRLKEENFNFEEIVKLCKCEQYQQTLQEIKAIAEKELSYDMVGNEHRHYRNYDIIRNLITKAEEE